MTAVVHSPLVLVLVLVALLSTGCHQLFGIDAIEHRPDASTSVDGGAPDDGDASGDASTARKLVFLTSVFKNGAMGGLTGADAHCQQLATGAGLPGTYMAWLSTSTESPASRMTRATVAYTLVGGAVIADNWDDLVDGQLRTAIVLTETGEGPAVSSYICQGGEVWSNTNADGTWSGLSTCSNWTTTTSTGSTGRFTTPSSVWTDGDCKPVACTADLPFYCFEQ